jgi:hypothetical protein
MPLWVRPSVRIARIGSATVLALAYSASAADAHIAGDLLTNRSPPANECAGLQGKRRPEQVMSPLHHPHRAVSAAA